MYIMMNTQGSHWPEAVAEIIENLDGSVIIQAINPDLKPFFEALTDKGVDSQGQKILPTDEGFLPAFEDIFCSGPYMYLSPEATPQIQSFATASQVA